MPRRFDSEFDPDELAKITHKGLTSLSRANEPRATQETVKLLKTAQQGEDTIRVKITRFFAAIFGGIASAFKSLLTPPRKRVVQCETYGHVIKPGWTGPTPSCEDCGKSVTSLDQLRKAVPKDDKKKGDDEQQQSGRRYVK